MIFGAQKKRLCSWDLFFELFFLGFLRAFWGLFFEICTFSRFFKANLRLLAWLLFGLGFSLATFALGGKKFFGEREKGGWWAFGDVLVDNKLHPPSFGTHLGEVFWATC